MPLEAFYLFCCLFPFLMTTLGSAAVFFCPRGMHVMAERIFFGFAGGVMIAASVWSLLLPALDAAETLGLPGWLCASVGVLGGSALLILSDSIAAHLQPQGSRSHAVTGASSRSSAFLLELAMTLHNVPEGIAVGLAVAYAADVLTQTPLSTFVFSEPPDPTVTSAWILACGIGIQNFPEGAAVSLPRCTAGVSRPRAFLHGMFSGIVEPIAAILTVCLFRNAHVFMPWLLSFAAGAMLHAACSELIPASADDSSVSAGTIGVIVGFVLMMALDVGLG